MSKVWQILVHFLSLSSPIYISFMYDHFFPYSLGGTFCSFLDSIYKASSSPNAVRAIIYISYNSFTVLFQTLQSSTVAQQFLTIVIDVSHFRLWIAS